MIYNNPPEYEKAIELLDEKIETFPEKIPKLSLKKAHTLKLKGDLEEGFKLVEELIELEPDNVYYVNAKVYWLLYMRREKEALETADKLIKLDPKDGNSYDTYGELLMEFGYYEEAIEKFKKAVKIEPYGWFSYETYIKMGICYKELGNYDLAMKNISKGRTITNTCLCSFETRKSLNKKISQHIAEIEELTK
jgi:tetratricopeptide (TPR) repeat protein